jgi:hypothetical protein
MSTADTEEALHEAQEEEGVPSTTMDVVPTMGAVPVEGDLSPPPSMNKKRQHGKLLLDMHAMQSTNNASEMSQSDRMKYPQHLQLN